MPEQTTVDPSNWTLAACRQWLDAKGYSYDEPDEIADPGEALAMMRETVRGYADPTHGLLVSRDMGSNEYWFNAASE